MCISVLMRRCSGVLEETKCSCLVCFLHMTLMIMGIHGLVKCAWAGLEVLGPAKVLGNQLPWRIWSSLVMRRTCSGMNQSYQSWPFRSFRIRVFPVWHAIFPVWQGLHFSHFSALTRPLSNWRKFLTKQRQWSRKALSLRTHHSWAHGKATDVRSIVQHRMRSPVKRLRSNGDRGTSVVRPFSALVAWRWAQISITFHCTEDVRCHTTVTTCYIMLLHIISYHIQ